MIYCLVLYDYLFDVDEVNNRQSRQWKWKYKIIDNVWRFQSSL